MISAWSSAIGSYSGLCGISQMWLFECLNVLTVASPSISAATMSPFWASGCRADNHQVAVENCGASHRVATDFEHEERPFTH